MKKHLVLPVVAVVAMGLLAGCSSGGTSSGGGNTISIAWSKLQQAGMDAVVTKFEADNPSITVKVQYYDAGSYSSLLRTQLQAGNAADIFYVTPGNGDPVAVQTLGAAGYLADLSNESWVSSVPASIATSGQFNGKTGALQMGITGEGAIYNNDTLTALGVTPPTTWAGVLDLCQKAQAAGKVAYAIGAQDGFATAGFINAAIPSLVYAPTPDFNQQMADGKATFVNSTGWNQTLDLYGQALQAGCFNASPAGTSFAQSGEMLANGQAAGMIDYYLVAGVAKATNPNATFTLTPLPTPQGQLMMSIGSGGGASINAKSQNSDAARKFVDYLATPANLQVYAAADAYSIPSVSSPSTTFTDPNLQVIQDYFTQGKSVAFVSQSWPNPGVAPAMWSGLQSFLAGAATKEQVLQDMQTAYDKK